MTTTTTNAIATPPPTSRPVDVRIPTGGYDLIVERAHAADVKPSHMVRRMLAYAADHMPNGWTPTRANRPKDRKLRFRIPTRAYDLITRRAHAADVKPSHMVRRMLAYAAKNMPDGWLPGRPTRTGR